MGTLMVLEEGTVCIRARLVILGSVNDRGLLKGRLPNARPCLQPRAARAVILHVRLGPALWCRGQCQQFFLWLLHHGVWTGCAIAICLTRMTG